MPTIAELARRLSLPHGQSRAELAITAGSRLPL
jgi:hypothetical protein